MKKLKLKIQELFNPSVLTRQQLKNVMGGTDPVTTASSKIAACYGKKEGEDCTWNWEGSPQYGTCQTYLGEIYCSDLS